ncbi:unnamed protein product [Sphenostylis stenocarpa]|uniref:Uncharacterized protein n=1 Tax=Sphenostylis stenocarpa TaxID=92480 RepID=A0AA86SLG1_9FABA|nr:unnamed protein product [Sphenostylis stenocarpa]
MISGYSVSSQIIINDEEKERMLKYLPIIPQKYLVIFVGEGVHRTVFSDLHRNILPSQQNLEVNTATIDCSLDAMEVEELHHHSF